MANRVSALEGHYTPGHIGRAGDPGVVLKELPDLMLTQVAVWPATLQSASAKIATVAGLNEAPGPGQSVTGADGVAMLRVEPLKWWLVGSAAGELSADEGALLDLSHSRTRVSVSGVNALDLLSRHLPLDLRPSSFRSGAVVSTAFHHVGITLWQAEYDYQIFLPRGFAVSLWQMMLETGEQFGCEIV